MFRYSLFFHNHLAGAFVRRCGLFVLACLLAGASLLAQAAPTDADAAQVVFVAGAVHANGEPLLIGQSVKEGKLIATGADGYVYLKTVDGGFLILRPNTQAKIVAYHIDEQHPENSRVKLELLGGVARSISGEGVKQARQHFRFNTPVAAIGVRGTDFTVFTDQDTSRVAVVSGGVIVSPFVGGCRPEGGGPCEGDASRELFASQVGQVLEINKGQSVPQLLRGSAVAPEGVAPPRADEPPVKTGDAASNRKSSAALSPPELSLDAVKLATLKTEIQAIGNSAPPPAAPAAPAAPVVQAVPVVPVAPVTPIAPVAPVVTVAPVVPEVPVVAVVPEIPAVPPPSQLIWGRWQAVLDQAVNADLTKLMDGSTRLVAMNNPFALLRQKTADWQVPTVGSMGFALQQSEAYILNEPTTTLSAAKVENGKLNVNFADASFSTSLDLVSQAALYKLQAQGAVTADGMLAGKSQFSSPTNMFVTGALGAEKSGTAAYLFQSRLDATHTVTGATFWGNGH